MTWLIASFVVLLVGILVIWLLTFFERMAGRQEKRIRGGDGV